MLNSNIFLQASNREISEFVSEYYGGSPERDLITELTEKGKTVIELPSDYEPLLFLSSVRNYTKTDHQKWEKRLENFDFIVLYHGTSTVYQDEIVNQGLLPRELTGNGNFEGKLVSIEDSIYLGQLNFFGSIFNNVKKHAVGVAELKGGLPLILRVIVELSELLPDEDVEPAENGLQSIALGGSARIKGGLEHGSVFLYPQSEEVLSEVYKVKINEFGFNSFNRFYERRF